MAAPESTSTALPRGSRPALDDLSELITDWVRSLRSANKSPRTVIIYRDTGMAFLAFLIENGMPTVASSLTREHVEHYLVHLAERPHRRKPGQKVSPAYVSQQYRALQQLFKWLRTEGEITVDPFDRMSPPAVPEQPVPVLTEPQLSALLATCRGSTFTDRRDTAIIRSCLIPASGSPSWSASSWITSTSRWTSRM